MPAHHGKQHHGRYRRRCHYWSLMAAKAHAGVTEGKPKCEESGVACPFEMRHKLTPLLIASCNSTRRYSDARLTVNKHHSRMSVRDSFSRRRRNCSCQAVAHSMMVYPSDRSSCIKPAASSAIEPTSPVPSYLTIYALSVVQSKNSLLEALQV